MHEEQPKKKRSLPGALKFALIAIGGIIFGRLVSSLFDGGGSARTPDVSPLLIIPAIIVAVFLTLVLHEVGHLIGGRLSGGRVALFIVGPLRLQFTAEGLKPSLNRSLALAGGLAGSAPTNARSLRRKMSLMTAGGPVMSFLVAGLAYALGAVIPGGFVSALLVAITLMSTMIGVVTLVPMRNGGFMTDGARLFMLYRGGPGAERWGALAALGGASMFGERPREWDESLIEKSLSPADGSLDDAGASLNAAHRALDLGNTEEAKSLLQRATNATDVPESIRSQALLESAFFHAFFEGDPESSRELYSKANPKSVMEEHLLLRAESAVLLAEGEVEEARDRARLALKNLGGSMSPGTARLEGEWLQDLEDGRSPATMPNPRKVVD